MDDLAPKQGHVRQKKSMAEEIKRFEMVSATDVGRVRSHNEDSISADPDIGVATLADGMGGYNAGEVASGIAVAMIPAEMRKLCAEKSLDQLPDSEIEQRVAEQARKVNTAIYNAAQKESQYAGMGTTLVVACWHHNKVTVGHLGDSRMYRVRGAKIEALTKDHSWVQEQIDKGLMTYEESRASKKKNLVTRACGIDPNVVPEVHTHDVEQGDIYILCSDGLYDMVPDDEIHLTLTSLKSNLTLAAQQLVQQANDNGGRDNISVILVHVLQGHQQQAGFLSKLKSWFK
jgi:serine/threonine protein phosphatase PrpC